MPAYYSAIRALDSLDKPAIVEMKSYTKPPDAVELVMNAVCLLFKKKQSWDEGKRLLGDMNFLESCKTYDKDKIPKKTQREL